MAVRINQETGNPFGKRFYSNGGANPNKSIDKSEKSDIIKTEKEFSPLKSGEVVPILRKNGLIVLLMKNYFQ